MADTPDPCRIQMNAWDVDETFAEMIHYTTERLGTAVMQAENHLNGRVLDAFCESHETMKLTHSSLENVSGHKQVQEAKRNAVLQEENRVEIPVFQLLLSLLSNFAVRLWLTKCHLCLQHLSKRMLPQLKKRSMLSQKCKKGSQFKKLIGLPGT